MSVEKRISRRRLLREVAALGAGLAFAGPMLAACGPTPTPKVVKETIVVEKEKLVEKPVTQVVEKVVTKEVVKEVPVAKGVATLRYGTYFSGTRLPIVQEGVKEFEGKFPSIKIQVEGGFQTDKLVLQFTAGTGPDVVVGHTAIWARLMETGQVLRIDDRVKAAGWNLKDESDWINTGDGVWEGKTYGLPVFAAPHAWYYNKTMLKEVGAKDIWDDLGGNWTWQDQLEMALKVTRDVDKDGKIDNYGIYGHGSMTYRCYGYIWATGTDYVNKTADPDPAGYRKWRYQYTHPDVLRAIKWWVELSLKHKVVIPDEQMQALSQAGVANLLAAGKVCMNESSSGWLEPAVREIKNYEWDVAPIPREKAGGIEGITEFTDAPHGINVRTPFPDQAWEYIKYMSEADGFQRIMALQKLLTPVRMSVATDKNTYLKPPPAHTKIFLTQPKRNWPANPTLVECNKNDDEFTDYMFLGKMSVEEAMAKLEKINNEILSKGLKV